MAKEPEDRVISFEIAGRKPGKGPRRLHNCPDLGDSLDQRREEKEPTEPYTKLYAPEETFAISYWRRRRIYPDQIPQPTTDHIPQG